MLWLRLVLLAGRRIISNNLREKRQLCSLQAVEIRALLNVLSQALLDSMNRSPCCLLNGTGYVEVLEQKMLLLRLSMFHDYTVVAY
nr:hypothetical protein Iba_chr12bCG2230 [Ipomoea batatas]GMD65105.1 hypothetical protein Iba_chr12cCG2190 [Ipomoea batatas]GME18349.1 hypothetical protein Iba_scaffold20445CG0050 [Ipomoea batatas]